MKLKVDFSDLHYLASHIYVGSIVPIYKKPLSKEFYQGEAKLVKFVSFDADTQLQTWIISFLGEQEEEEEKDIFIEIQGKIIGTDF